MSRQVQLWLAFTAIAVYAAGIGTGVMVEGVRRPEPRHAADVRRASPAVLASLLARELDLSDEQQRTLDRIVAERRQAFLAARDALRERIESDASGLAVEIREQLRLTPDQRARFDIFAARVRSHYVAAEPAAAREENRRPRGL